MNCFDVGFQVDQLTKLAVATFTLEGSFLKVYLRNVILKGPFGRQVLQAELALEIFSQASSRAGGWFYKFSLEGVFLDVLVG